MSEIEKMYENAGIKPTYTDECQMVDSYYSMEKVLNERGILFDDYMKQNCPNKNEVCYETCPYAYNKEFYPPFTAEKQIAILIALANYNLYEEDKRLMIDSFNGEIYIGFYQDITLEANATDKDFAECVAKLVNKLWKDLTEEEKQQVKKYIGNEHTGG